MGSGLRTFKTKAFARFADSSRLDDTALCDAIRRAQEGMISANLGGGVIKQRVARRAGGRARGFRTIILFRRGSLAFFAYGFAKNAKKNLTPNELVTHRLMPKSTWP